MPLAHEFSPPPYENFSIGEPIRSIRINLPAPMIVSLQGIAPRLSRSALVGLIVEDWLKSGRKIELGPETV